MHPAPYSPTPLPPHLHHLKRVQHVVRDQQGWGEYVHQRQANLQARQRAEDQRGMARCRGATGRGVIKAARIEALRVW